MDRLRRSLRVGAAVLASAALGCGLFLFLAERGPLTLKVPGGQVVLVSPRWLALLACLPLLIGLARLSLTELSWRRRAFRVGLRFVFLVLLSLALTDPALRFEKGAVSVVALADVSESITPLQLADTQRFTKTLRAAAARRTQPVALRQGIFAAEARELGDQTSTLTRFPPPLGLETDLSLALSLGLGWLEPGRVPRLLLLSDGRATRGDALATAMRAAQRGARIFYYQPRGAPERDVAILGLTAPDEIRPRAPFDLEIRLFATQQGTIQLRLTRDGRPHAPLDEQSVEVLAGVTTVRWPTGLEEAAVAIYRAEALAASDNRRPQNDLGVLAIAPQSRPRVLVVEATGAGTGAFVRALSAEGIGAHRKAPAALVSARLVDYELVVLADLPRSALGAAAQDALERFVKSGGGLLVAGGPASFGSGGYGGTKIASLLPVRHDPADRREEATLALALVIDRSGSMSGPKMELTKEAARGTAQMLSPEDLIAVVVFDSQPHSVVRLQPASNRQRILHDLAQISASGGTNLLPALREAFEQLTAARARKKHVIVLSDGQSPFEGIPELVDDAAAARITVSAVGVGEGADQTLLQTIAVRGGGRFYHTRDPSGIPRIFSRETAEVSGSSVIEVPTRLLSTKKSEVLAGLSLESAPALRGYTRTRPQARAEVLLATEQGDPLLARWQVGLGQVVAWTSDLSARWSVDLARWSKFPKLWAQVSRGAMRRGASHQFPIRARLLGDRVLARFEAVGSDDRPLAGLAGSLTVRPVPTTPAEDVPAAFSLPLHEAVPGRYEAELPVPAAGALLFSAELHDGRARIAEGQGRLAIPFARELLPELPGPEGDPPLVGRALLQALAAQTGGGEAINPDVVLDARSDRAVSARPLRIPLLLLAFLVFLAEVAVRRVTFSRS